MYFKYQNFEYMKVHGDHIQAINPFHQPLISSAEGVSDILSGTSA
jgi:hypothetical protein